MTTMNYILSLNQPGQIIFKKISTIFWTMNLIFFSFLAIFYIFQVGTLTQKIYLIKDYEKRLEKLSKENEVLEINLSKSDSLNNIENYLLNGNFVRANPGQVKYIRILEGTVVTNK
jgi:hypothetical protein